MCKKLKEALELVKAHPGQSVAIAAMLVAVAALMALVLPKVLGWVAVGLLVLWVFYEPHRPTVQPPPYIAEDLLMDLLFQVFTIQNHAALFGIIAPETASMMDCGLHNKGPLEVIYALVELAPNTMPNCPKFKRLLQQRLDAACAERRLPPLFAVVEVQDTAAGGILIQVAYLDGDERQRQYKAYLGQKEQEQRTRLTVRVEAPDDDEF
ncbi:hypothetical protein CE91St41_36860 [Oscillospiraceae bacterium]|nr:hypothetical protein CE91St40_36840 [Oscillospiraceae bacterium]BDF76797.1 hypothetical protein CE91St41_36860 [Oscillospiraceae bacterium]